MIPTADAARFGDPGLDADHRRHASLLNRIEEALLDGDDIEGRRLVQSLLASLQRHFRAKERALRQQDIPHLRDHARNHEAALLMLEDVDRRLAQGGVGAALSRLEDVTTFYVDVLVEHDAVMAAPAEAAEYYAY